MVPIWLGCKNGKFFAGAFEKGERQCGDGLCVWSFLDWWVYWRRAWQSAKRRKALPRRKGSLPPLGTAQR